MAAPLSLAELLMNEMCTSCAVREGGREGEREGGREAGREGREGKRGEEGEREGEGERRRGGEGEKGDNTITSTYNVHVHIQCTLCTQL